MGTNYYLHERPPCRTCGHCAGEPLHIGKSSGGWCFSLHVMPEHGINTLEDWIARWSEPGANIRNEYGEAVTAGTMLSVITERTGIKKHNDPSAWVHEPWYSSEEDFHKKNGSMRGPNGLVRRAISKHCVGHGEGTWDYIAGYFS